MKCNVCPRNCNAKRSDVYGSGFCSVGNIPKIAKVMLHHFEEPVISGTRGSGAIFFSGCPLKCVYCQNFELSRGEAGEYVKDLPEIINKLERSGAHNINLVTPTHYALAINEALKTKPKIPVVYNCSGYESIKTLELLKDKIDIYLTDFKYGDNTISEKYSKVSDYAEVAKCAIKKMYENVGDFVIDEEGIMQKGLIIRHLILPGYMENSKKIIDFVAGEFKDKKVMFSLMGQYTPFGEVAEKYPEINKTVSAPMYKKLCQYMEACGIKYGYTQELSSADSMYTPNFKNKIFEI